MKTLLQISKAVLVRNHPDFTRIFERLFEVFDIEEISWDAARAIGELGGSDTILTKRNHAVIKVSVHIVYRWALKITSQTVSSCAKVLPSGPSTDHRGCKIFDSYVLSSAIRQSPGDGCMVPDPQRQTAYLVALTTLIKSVPKTMYMHELSSVYYQSSRI